MSWLYSRALVEEFLEAASSDGAPFAPSSGNPIPQAYLPPDKMTAFSRPSRYGMTFAPLTDDLGADLLTWFLADSRVRTSATQETKPASRGSGQGSGKRWPGSFAKWDRDMCSWKTSQLSLVEDSTLFSGTWPKWGSMLDGECWELPTLAASRPAKGYGLWPTLKASDGEQYSSRLEYFERRVQVAPDLPVIVGLSTPPTTEGYYGRLNPDWCEWLMGWPAGWTAFGSLEMDKIHEWQRQHSPCSRERSDVA